MRDIFMFCSGALSGAIILLIASYAINRIMYDKATEGDE
jgi:hypothetical protein